MVLLVCVVVLLVSFVLDIKGKYINKNTLHLHVEDYWTNFHDPHKKFFWYSESLFSKLERHIRRKWKKILPNIDVFLKD